MALRLASVNLWCVSGTPVQRGLEGTYNKRLIFDHIHNLIRSKLLLHIYINLFV